MFLVCLASIDACQAEESSKGFTSNATTRTPSAERLACVALRRPRGRNETAELALWEISERRQTVCSLCHEDDPGKKIEAAQHDAETSRHQLRDMDASEISPQGLKPIICDFDTKLFSLSAEQRAVIGNVIQYTRRARIQCDLPKAEWEKWTWAIKASKLPLHHFGLQEP